MEVYVKSYVLVRIPTYVDHSVWFLRFIYTFLLSQTQQTIAILMVRKPILSLPMSLDDNLVVLLVI